MRIFFSLILFMEILFAGFPDYYYKLPIKEQKQEFKNILIPMVVKENQKIMNERKMVIDIFNDPFFMMNPQKIAILSRLAKNYKISDIYDKEAFLKRIDIVPPLLVLAQGATESAWGRSYFVKKANNIFGQWTYQKSGLIPRRRDENATHRIRVFKTLEDSLAVYMRNLNRNRAYREFRDLRAKYRSENKVFSATKAATTLHRYSQLGQKYVKLLQTMIKQFKGQ